MKRGQRQATSKAARCHWVFTQPNFLPGLDGKGMLPLQPNEKEPLKLMNQTTNTAYQILLTRQPAVTESAPHCWRATVLSLPELKSEACSRGEALEQIQQRLSDFLRESEIVTVSVPQTALNGASEMEALGYRHFGVFANDPEALRLFDEIEEARNQHLVEPAQV